MKELKDVLIKVLKNNYANFKGRASRSEFWLFAFMQYIYMVAFILLFYVIFLIGALFIISKSHDESPMIMAFVVLMVYGAAFLVFLPILIPSLATMTRRLHDTDRSGWWILLMLVPVASLFIIYFLVQQGTKGANKYGEDPRIEEYKEYLNSLSPLKE